MSYEQKAEEFRKSKWKGRWNNPHSALHGTKARKKLGMRYSGDEKAKSAARRIIGGLKSRRDARKALEKY